MSSTSKPNETLVRAIDDAFANTKYPGDDRLVYDTSGRHSECNQTAEDFKGKQWTELSFGFLRAHCDSIFFLTPEAYRFYLPAYLLASVLRYREADVIPSNIVYSLTPPREGADTSIFRERAEYFDRNQRKAIKSFLEFLQAEHGSDFPFRDPEVALKKYWILEPTE
jgi:hypothetical protein